MTVTHASKKQKYDVKSIMAQICGFASRVVGSKPLMHTKTFVYIGMNSRHFVLHWCLLCNQFNTKNIDNHVKRLKKIDVTQVIECYTDIFKLFLPETFR